MILTFVLAKKYLLINIKSTTRANIQQDNHLSERGKKKSDRNIVKEVLAL